MTLEVEGVSLVAILIVAAAAPLLKLNLGFLEQRWFGPTTERSTVLNLSAISCECGDNKFPHFRVEFLNNL